MPSEIKDGLINSLSGRRVAVIGIGNVEKGDDGFGVHLARRLKKRLESAAIFECGTAPENYLGPIAKLSPQVLLLIDAADFGAEPGYARIIEEPGIEETGLSTHDSSLNLFICYLKNEIRDLKVLLLCVQPKTTMFGRGISEELRIQLKKLEDVLSEALG